MRAIKRGEVYFANLSPDAIGSEEKYRRPVLILQNDIGNEHAATTIVAAMTSQERKKHLPFHVGVKMKHKCFTSVVMLEHIRTIDKSRLESFVGRLTADDMKRVDAVLKKSLALVDREVKTR